MNSQWFSAITLIAALIIGYSVISGRDDGMDTTQGPAIIQSYFLKDAIITETAADGAPRARFAADEVTQISASSVALTAVRVDYVVQTDNAPARWVLNADSATAKTLGHQATQQVQLRGNVHAHSIGAPHEAVLRTESLDIDGERQSARTIDPVDIDLDGHSAHGRGMLVNMKDNHVQLLSNVTLRVAAQPTNAITPGGPSKGAPKVALPDLFEYHAIQLDIKDNVLTMTKVRSVRPPLVAADQARATGTDLANNEVVLTDNVRIELPDQGVMTADTATITVRDSQVVRAIVSGAPVNLEHRPKDSQETVYGHATNIDYDVLGQSVLFSGDAWFSKGEYEFKSESIHYNLATQAVRAGRGSIGLGSRKTDSTPDANSSADAPKD